MTDRLYSVIGIDDLEGTTFCRCTTLEKAEKAKALLEAEGFENILDIVQDEIPMDVVYVGEQMIEL